MRRRTLRRVLMSMLLIATMSLLVTPATLGYYWDPNPPQANGQSDLNMVILADDSGITFSNDIWWTGGPPDNPEVIMIDPFNPGELVFRVDYDLSALCPPNSLYDWVEVTLYLYLYYQDAPLQPYYEVDFAFTSVIGVKGQGISTDSGSIHLWDPSATNAGGDRYYLYVEAEVLVYDPNPLPGGPLRPVGVVSIDTETFPEHYYILDREVAMYP